LVSEKIYGALIMLFSISILIYMTLAYTNVLLSEGIQTLYPYLGQLFFGPWVYLILPIMLGEIIVFGILMWIGWEKMTSAPGTALEKRQKIILEEENKEKKQI